MENLKEGALAFLILPLLGLLWAWIKGKLPRLLSKMMGGRLRAALRGDGIADKDVREYVQQITYATVMLAEKKFPNEGMGKDKFEFVFKLLSQSVPWLSGFIKDNGSNLAEVINNTVKEMDAEFQRLISSNKKKIALLPYTPNHRLPVDE